MPARMHDHQRIFQLLLQTKIIPNKTLANRQEAKTFLRNVADAHPRQRHQYAKTLRP